MLIFITFAKNLFFFFANKEIYFAKYEDLAKAYILILVNDTNYKIILKTPAITKRRKKRE